MISSAITSSNIAHAGYDSGNLYIKFNSGRTYLYTGVPIEKYTQLVNAPSAGKYFAAEIREFYEYEEVGDVFAISGT